METEWQMKRKGKGKDTKAWEGKAREGKGGKGRGGEWKGREVSREQKGQRPGRFRMESVAVRGDAPVQPSTEPAWHTTQSGNLQFVLRWDGEPG